MIRTQVRTAVFPAASGLPGGVRGAKEVVVGREVDAAHRLAAARGLLRRLEDQADGRASRRRARCGCSGSPGGRAPGCAAARRRLGGAGRWRSPVRRGPPRWCWRCSRRRRPRVRGPGWTAARISGSWRRPRRGSRSSAWRWSRIPAPTWWRSPPPCWTGWISWSWRAGAARQRPATGRPGPAAWCGATAAGPWPGADVELACDSGQWRGVGAGEGDVGRLSAREVRVQLRGRGVAPAGRDARLLLPGPAGESAVDAEGAPAVVAVVPRVIERREAG